MIRRRERGIALALMWLLAGPASATVFSGEVRMLDAQAIDTPPSLSSPVVLRYYMPDGAQARPGDVVLRIDAGSAEAQLRNQRAELVQAQAKAAKDIADLELKQSDAELALADAQAERDTAAVDAALPKTLLSALDYDRYQSEMQRTDRALELKRTEAAQAQAAVARRRKDAALELEKKTLSLTFLADQVSSAVVKATRAGTVVHGFDNLFGAGGRYEEGSTSYPGQTVGEVIGGGHRYAVRAWVLEPDRSGLKVGQAVALNVDALPGTPLAGTIEAIAGAASARPEWGEGRYVQVDITLPATTAMALRAGMSVRVDTDAAAPMPATRSIDDGPLDIDGEIFAQRSLAISPPAVDGLWQLTVTEMAGDGETIAKGAPLVVFDPTEVNKNLTAKRSELAEKLRKQEQLKLDLADRARDVELDTAKAQAELDKAQRKANQPQAYVPGVQYAKLVIDRRKAERRLALSQQRARVAMRARAAEQQLADAEVTQLQSQVTELVAALASLTVKAPRAGIVLHQSGWNGDKIDTGSQVWMGQSVAQMPDLSTLAVRAALPERALSRVHEGQRVQVVIAGGGGRRLAGRIVEIGHTVHSKSRVEAVPVVDLLVHLDAGMQGLKPGQAVRVSVQDDAVASR
ncbi:HlyD family secretion protein [Dyella sp.]|uniref:HlyD family secretion protein n=1 Tax=Dyella sp. TaxID=1869338 RepID=UPI002D787F99|nr:HlyD family efflux transporter periplasmic adaptor subunit [Dyella sp.]HET6431983.1 HlyD family efflux transporter periplasmic adaptor subunit [Dyella sp.]